jgi:hypothetical protein
MEPLNDMMVEGTFFNFKTGVVDRTGKKGG